MPYDNTDRKLVFGIKFVFLEHSANLLGILKHLFLIYVMNKIKF